MIENIYSNEKGEKEEKEVNNTVNTFKLPKNIRQIGQAEGNKRIYIEDYVMNFTKQLALKEYGIFDYAVLVGHYVKVDGNRNIFIHGAIEIKDMDSKNQINFSNDAWTDIYESIKKYFNSAEIVGWYVGGAGLSLEADDRITKIHMDNFAGQDKTLFMYDSLEQEEAFFIYENNHLKKQQGYYIYYERNEEMQNYMIDNKGGVSEEANFEDNVTKEIRRVLEVKKDSSSNKHVMHLLYGASTVLAVIVLVITANMLHNSEQMSSMQESLNVLSENFAAGVDKIKQDNSATNDTKTASDDNSSEGDKTEVETMNGNVSTIKDEKIVGDTSNNTNTKNNQTSDNDKSEPTTEKGTKDSDDKTSKTSETSQTNKTTKTPQKEEDTKESDKQTGAKETKAAKDAATVKTYTIRKGDTLASISLKFYHTTAYIDDILALNNIKDQNKILQGKIIKLP